MSRCAFQRPVMASTFLPSGVLMCPDTCTRRLAEPFIGHQLKSRRDWTHVCVRACNEQGT